MGGKQSKLVREITLKNDTKQDSDDNTGCCIKINKLRMDTTSSFSCCIKGDKTDAVIIVGDNNRIENNHNTITAPNTKTIKV